MPVSRLLIDWNGEWHYCASPRLADGSGPVVPQLVCFGNELMRHFQVEEDACLARFNMPYRIIAVIDSDELHIG